MLKSRKIYRRLDIESYPGELYLGWRTSINASLIHRSVSLFGFAEYETNKRMTVWDLISNIGGLLGVCAGISILSCAEFVYWLVLRGITH